MSGWSTAFYTVINHSFHPLHSLSVIIMLPMEIEIGSLMSVCVYGGGGGGGGGGGERKRVEMSNAGTYQCSGTLQ